MKLSVIVVVYNMTREAPRTLASLATSYQRGVDADEYEVIVVENGSTRRLDPAVVDRLGKNFHYHYLENASPSPAGAINFGMRQARGEVLGVMVDGARICTPGVLHHALCATRMYRRAVVGTLGFYLGNGAQRYAILHGYDHAAEDALLAHIGWPSDGYRLFEVGALDESSHWFLPMAESNALFMHRDLWAELNGFDERFDYPGGGLVNLDTFVRAAELPESKLVVLLGEGTFHQLHGGIATNTPLDAIGPTFEIWSSQYRALRGKDFMEPKRPRSYFGELAASCLPHVANELGEMLKERWAMERSELIAALTSAREEAERVRAEVVRIKGVADGTAVERDRAQVQLDLLRGSHSWYLTRPLRTAYRGVSALRNRISRLGRNGSTPQT